MKNLIRNKLLAVLIIALLISFPTTAQNKIERIRPITFLQLQDSMQLNPKPILIKIFTNWCVYCKMQDAQILKSDSIQQLLCDRFYYVEFDAESKEEIIFNGHKFQYINSSGVHQLAVLLGSDKSGLSYPVMALLDHQYRGLFRSNGLVSAKNLFQILNTVPVKPE